MNLLQPHTDMLVVLNLLQMPCSYSSEGSHIMQQHANIIRQPDEDVVEMSIYAFCLI